MNNRNMNHIFRKIRNAIDAGVNFMNKKLGEQREDPNIIDAPQPPAIYAEKPLHKILGAILTVVGFAWGGVTCLAAMVLLLGASIVGEMALGMGFTVVNALVIAGCGFMVYKGITMMTSIDRFRMYQKAIGDEELCNIKVLAEKVKKTDRFVVKDIEKMIRKGWFCQGHLDNKKTCLMVTDRMFREYRNIEAAREQHQIEEEARKAQAKKNSLSPEARRIVDQGEEYVRKIRQCNDAIPGKVISEKIDHMEVLVDRIFDRVEQNPASVGDIRRLMEYYLPTTIKLLEAYAEMDAQPVGGENIQAAKSEIENSLDTINVAFEKLLDSLYQDTAWDISSDISVLNTMLAQEGLTEDGLKKQ